MNVSTLTAKAESLGYAVAINEGELRYVQPANRDTFTPELFGPSLFEPDAGWSIQTTAYGTLSPEEISKVVDGYGRAQRMVAALNQFAS